MSVRKITLYDYLQRSLEKFPDNKSYSFINGEGLTYRQFGEKVKLLQQILGNNGIGQGDRVAILGSSMPSWPVAYMAVTTSARIAVPILPDFTAFEISNVITHSESKAIFVSKKLLYKLSESIKSRLNLIVLLDTFEIIKGEAGATADAPCEPLPESESVASIIYTSGTSGTSKGVMLTHGNITSNLQMMYELYPVMENDVFLSLLPLSHAYECTIGMLYPLTEGASVYYLDGAPTPSALIPALKKVRPTCILSVPLIVEKIYKNKIRPIFTRNWIMQTLYSIMPVRRILHKFAGKKLLEMFGGRLRFFGIGGAKLDGMVELFLRDAGFPYAIGYGLTECSPLIAGAVGKFKYQTTGPALKWLDVRIADADKNGVGEIQVKGPNVMKGYFKDPLRTEAAFTADGYFKTKDLGKMDKEGAIFIKGRADNMVLGPNGENIYPEEIEAIIQENDFVMECIVVQDKGKNLVAKVHFNYDQIDAIKELETEIRKNLAEKYEQLNEKYEQLGEKYKKLLHSFFEKKEGENAREDYLRRRVIEFNEKLESVKKNLLEYVNSRVNKSSRLSEIVEQTVPFEKTATQKIKRFLYK